MMSSLMSVVRGVRKLSRQTFPMYRCLTSGGQGQRTRPGYRVSFFYEGRFLLLIFPGGCLYMMWKQTKRKEAIEAEIARLKPRLEEPPVSLPQNLSDLQNMELRSVTVRGHFDYTNEVYLGPKSDSPESGFGTRIAGQKVSGVHVITPFRLADRDLTILVNRGWFQSDKFIDKEAREKGRIYGEQELTGVLRLDQPRPSGIWGYVTDIDKSMRQYECDVYVNRNLKLLAERCGTAPVFLDAKLERPSQFAPKPIQPKIELSTSQSIQNIFTWGMLACTSLYFWLRAYRTPARPTKYMIFSINKKQNMEVKDDNWT